MYLFSRTGSTCVYNVDLFSFMNINLHGIMILKNEMIEPNQGDC